MTWLQSAAHQRWLEAEFDRLLAFGAASMDPAGGFGWLTETGERDLNRPVELWITCRMTHIFSLGAMLGRPSAGPLADHGVAALAGRLADAEYGGWYAAVDAGGVANDVKEAYGHAFVILAAASAVAAGRPGAKDLLDQALALHRDKFWDPVAGMSVEGFNRDFTVAEEYRGINANMHTVEAYIAAADVTGDRELLSRALRITTRAVHEYARSHNWHLPEHFTATWEPQLNYNQHEPAHPFRPYGATIGHWFEWARLTLGLAHSLDSAGMEVPDWMVPDAIALYDAGVATGWAVDGAPGFVYTVDFGGKPVVHERMHWVVAEAIGAAAVLFRQTGAEKYAAQYQQWWEYAARYHRDEQHGSWWHELDSHNQVSRKVWEGKPDIYHAAQATLIPLTGVGPALAAALRGRNLQ